MPSQKPFNPFYVLLVLLGIVFGVTACAYGVMTVKMSSAAGVASSLDSPVLAFLNDHGLTLLLVELALLALASFAAMGTDSYWTKRNDQEPPHDAPDGR
jgi:hypothetical protein